MATIAEKITALETELAAYKAARLSMLTTGQSVSINGLSRQSVNVNAVNDLITATEKSIQRLQNGGRGLNISLGYTPYGDGATGQAEVS